MEQYKNYTDQHMRNKDNPSSEEAALADFQADEEVDRFLKRYANEPVFLKRIAPKLFQKLADNLPSHEGNSL
ncbi:hypothetical protein [Bradyrhizobium elkanii]|uniref:Anti-sigma factor NepR domain-containing protein n=1 Tax=Bradyrhizobium elkanii TaxID=29448 RepID=A0ABV4F811_BRAEL|nr:hypothetical protein [Bradyrhizobium elkanii]MCP1751186.1 hypothetical protein [Bradyrhizobium elkanii]MCP1976958.1 hypothetical protein [Bradyrhizobium elkanii]MCS3888524.1 hypothetical protein [Bradyrhizobium elkanii]MCS4212454.1 hypothetical protein [Bradyrhizobium elkanii]MCW2191911.1 hypothetical protein [Bradyrhizobium elkanii]